MESRRRRNGAAAIAAAVAAGMLAAAPAAAQQNPPEKLPETYVRSAPGATAASLEADGERQQPEESPTGLRAGPTPTPEGGFAGSEVGASDKYGFDDSQLNERARLAYPE